MAQVLIDTKVVEQVIAAMGCVGADIVCQASHHAKKDEHDGLRHCPVGERWHKAFDELRAALANAERVEPDASVLFAKLTDAQRMEIFSNYCTSCGTNNPSCQCWNDE